MRAIYPLLLTFSLLACSEAQLPYKPEQITTDRRISVEKDGLRGISLSDGTVYFVEDDMRTLSRYNDGELIWRSDVPISEESHVTLDNKPLPKPKQDPSISYLSYGDTALTVMFYKSCWATVQTSNGAVDPEGCD